MPLAPPSGGTAPRRHRPRESPGFRVVCHTGLSRMYRQAQALKSDFKSDLASENLITISPGI